MNKICLMTRDWVQIYGDDHGKVAPIEEFNNGKFAFKQVIKVDDNFYLKVKFAVPLEYEHLIESLDYNDFSNDDEEILFMYSYADNLFNEKKSRVVQGLVKDYKREIYEKVQATLNME